jgi:hypothetical protein
MKLQELHALIEKEVNQVHFCNEKAYYYGKIVRTGDLDFNDFGAGILNFKIGYVFHNLSKRHCVQMTISNIDDGLLVSRAYYPTLEDCIVMIDMFANSQFYKTLTTFPCLEDLQVEVTKFGFFLELE